MRTISPDESDGLSAFDLDEDRVSQNLNIAPSSSNIRPISDSDSRIISNLHSKASVEAISELGMDSYESPESALLSYSRTNEVEKLSELLERKSNGNISLDLNHKGTQKQNYTWSAMHLACYFGHSSIVELLLSDRFKKELDINIRNASGDTPLHKAALTNRSHIVQLLLSNGANIFIKNCDDVLAKQLTSDKHIYKMLEASEQSDMNLLKQRMFKAVNDCDLKKLQEYFQDHVSLHEFAELGIVAEEAHDGEQSNHSNSSGNDKLSIPNPGFINQMTDERGNTLLHLAAMGGSKAICVYLLEQGFDPYRKNNLGQTCIEISSYQLRQLFMSVKPAGSQLKKLTRTRVTRFEGPLMRKVRLLGWRQIYVVLENGVILLFNNRHDSMNKSRRGYKYLESATCEPDPNEVGMFTVNFSDNSRATFLVGPNHMNYYTSFKLPESGRQASCGQIELVRQKWLDSIRDHIVYSTEFIRKGLKLDDDEEFENMNYDGDSLSSLNHLLPMDTIKLFVQEARAHYSILERHAESLCGLAQSITIANQETINNHYETLSNQQRTRFSVQRAFDSKSNASSTSSTSARGRFFGLMRSQPRARTSISSAEEGFEPLNRAQISVTNNSGSNQARQVASTNEFIHDNWPCLLFHLRLLMESAENTKTSMGQALALMEHQEHLRQNRIQEQDERCRVLEDSLQALARDHHELEKSLSMSQIYHSACRSVSMLTDLNEYHDAFEDFDDDKTMTPNSWPSEEELDKRIHEVMNDTEFLGEGTSRSLFGDKEHRDISSTDDEEDLVSNCSALTVETVTDNFSSANDISEIGQTKVDRQVGR